MKKQLVVASLIMLGIFTISCGGKNENGKIENELKSEEVADCACNTLTDESENLINPNFTGTCVDKDQNDTIILKREYKNGFIISEMQKEKVNGKYFVIKDMTYDNGKENNGFVLNNRFNDYRSYKNGNIFDGYEIFVFFNDNQWDIRSRWQFKGGKDLSDYKYTDEDLYNKLTKPLSMSDANALSSESNWYFDPYLDKETGDKVLKALEKELPHSSYYIEKVRK